VSDTLPDLEGRYARALGDYLGGAGEAALHEAYEIGRRALARGLGILDIAAVHYRAVATALPDAPGLDEQSRTVKEMEGFLFEALSPFEMAYRGVQEANSVLRRLNEKLEEDARRIARTLHDEARQLLAAVYMSVADVAHELTPSARERLGQIHRLLDEIDAQLRHIAHELRPAILDELGLVPAIQFLVEGVSKRTGLSISVTGSTGGRLPPPREIAVYRVIQEALTNVTKHSQGTSASVRFERDGPHVVCEIRDDGVGFDATRVSAEKGGLGLGRVGMR